MSQQIFGAAAAVIALNRAFNDESPANAVFQNQLAAAQADAANGFANFAKAFSASFAGLSNTELAAQVMGNMGLLPNDALEAALVDYLNGPGATNRGLVVLQLATILTGLEHATGNLSVYNAAAAAWNSEITNAYTYSADPANTVPSGDETTAGKTFVLTTGIDSFMGTAGNDTFNAYPVKQSDGSDANTLNTWDAIDGGAGNDVLNIFVKAGFNAAQVGSIKNIDTINIDNSDAGDQLFGGGKGIDAALFVGATTINQIDQANNIHNLAAGTTAVLTTASIDITVAAAAAAASADVKLVDAASNVDGDYGFESYTDSTLNVEGAALNTVTVTGGAKTSAAGDKVYGKTLINDTTSVVNLHVGAGAAQKSLTINADSALNLEVHGDKLTSLDTTGVANGVDFNSSQLTTVKTGAGDDYVGLNTYSVKDVAASVVDETVNVSVDTGAGNDYLGISAYGDGQTTIATGEGDDDMDLWVETRDGHAIGKVNADLGAGDDTLHLNSSLASTLTKLVGSTVTTSDVKLAGGEGSDTLSINDTSIEASIYDRIDLNVSGFETLEFRDGATGINASKLSQFSTLVFDGNVDGFNSVTKVAADQTVEFNGYSAESIAEASGYVYDADPAKVTYAGTLNAIVHDGANTVLDAGADVVNLTVEAKLYDIDTNFKEDVGTNGDASVAYIATGHFQTLNVALQSVSETGVHAGSENTSVLNFGYTHDDPAIASIYGTKSVVVSGQGHAEINANAVFGSTLKTIDLSGMTALVNLNNKGEQVTGELADSVAYGYLNLSTSEVYGNDGVAETIKLGGAQDTVITGSLGNKMDTITGFELTAKGSNADLAKSDDIDVTTAVYVDGNDFAKVKIDAGNSTLALALDQVAKSGVDQALFTLGGNTYIFVDSEDGGTYDADNDTLIKLVGTYDLDLLAQVVHGTIDLT